MHSLSMHLLRHVHVMDMCFILSPASTEPTFTLAVKVDSGHRRSKVIELRKVFCVEVLSPSWGVNSLTSQLSEQHENHAMNSHWWPWTLVAHHFLAYTQFTIILSHNSSYKITKIRHFASLIFRGKHFF